MYQIKCALQEKTSNSTIIIEHRKSSKAHYITHSLMQVCQEPITAFTHSATAVVQFSFVQVNSSKSCQQPTCISFIHVAYIHAHKNPPLLITENFINAACSYLFCHVSKLRGVLKWHSLHRQNKKANTIA